jgi:hypothetical protein
MVFKLFAPLIFIYFNNHKLAVWKEMNSKFLNELRLKTFGEPSTVATPQ